MMDDVGGTVHCERGTIGHDVDTITMYYSIGRLPCWIEVFKEISNILNVMHVLGRIVS